MKKKERLKFVLVVFSILLLMLFGVSCKEEAPTDPLTSTAQTSGSLDTSFVPGTGANNIIGAVALQSDGKIIIGGVFTSYNGVSRNRIARLNIDGSLDTSFDPGTGANNYIRTLAIQGDGKILIGGSFTTYNGTDRNSIARINSNGTLDTSFNPGTGADGIVRAMSWLFIGGDFSTYNGSSRSFLARLNSDGTLDTFFTPGFGPNNIVLAIALQSDGKILIGGWFTSYDGTARSAIARLNFDGTLDSSFNPGTGAEFDDTVRSIALQSDGKIIIGGDFTTYNGTSRIRIARLNSDGSLDTSFNPGTGANSNIYAIRVIQSDGKILIGGWFTSYNGVSRNRIARLNSDGSLDTSFDPGTGANNNVAAVARQSDGKIIIGGEFTSYNGTIMNRIARLLN